MADYSNYPDIRAAFDKLNELNNHLKGATGNAGLQAALDSVAQKNGEDSPEYRKVKADYDKVKQEVADTQAKITKLKEQVDAPAKAAKKKADTEKAAKDLERQVNPLQSQLDSARRQGDTTKMAELTTKINALKNPVKEGEGQTNNQFTGGINPADYNIYTDKAGNTYVTGTGSTTEFFVVPPKVAGGAVDAPVDNINTARNKLIEEFGGTEQLKVALKKAGFNSGNFYNDANGFLRAYSVNSMQSYIDGKGKGTLPTFTQAAATIASQNATGSTKTRVDQNFTDRTGADRYINVYMMDMVGRPATAEEKTAYYKALNAAESKTRTTTTTVADGQGGYKTAKSVGSTLNDTDRMLIATNVVKKSLKGITNVDALLSGAKGSRIATDIANIQKAANDYGLPIDSMTAFKYVSAGLGQADLVAKQTERMRQTAMTMYTNLTDHIKGGGTVKDIADQYALIKARKLGVTVADSTQDKDVMAAITGKDGLKSQADFMREMQANPLWGKTEEAHNIAADFTQTILRSFGFGG